MPANCPAHHFRWAAARGNAIIEDSFGNDPASLDAATSLIGIFFAYVFAILGNYYPGAFAVFGNPTPLSFYDCVYFSFTVLTSTGFGDVTPLIHQVRGLCIIEQVIGALFLAVLIARLAGVYPPGARDQA